MASPEIEGSATRQPSALDEWRDTPEFTLYQQLLALGSTLPPPDAGDAAAAATLAAFQKAAATAEELFTSRPPRYAENVMRHLLEMELALLRILPGPELAYRLAVYRSEFRRTSAEHEWEEHEALQKSLARDEAADHDTLRRAEATHLLLQMDRAPLIDRRAEAARTFLIARLWRFCLRWLIIAAIPIGLFFFDHLYLRYQEAPAAFESAMDPSYPGNSPVSRDIARVAIFAFVGAMGVLGAFVSASQRVQRMPISGRLARDTVALSSMADQLRWAPVTGGIFAAILCMTFWGGFLQGSLFPRVGGTPGHELTNVLYYNDQFAKLLVWSFLAGFSERLVPDLLDRLLTQGRREAIDKSRVKSDTDREAAGA